MATEPGVYWASGTAILRGHLSRGGGTVVEFDARTHDPTAMCEETALRERLAEAPSSVAFEGYDTVVVLAELLRRHGPRWARGAEAWPSVTLEATRGHIRFSRTPAIGVWRRTWPPIQVVDRDPAARDRFRILHTG